MWSLKNYIYVRKLVYILNTGWHTKCHAIDCAHNTFLLLQKRLTSGTELILIGWKIVPNEEHVQCDHRFASQPLANEPLHSSQLFDTSLQKARGTTSLCGPWAALHFLLLWRPENVAQLRAHIVKLCQALSEDLCRKVVTNARVHLKRLWGKTVVILNMFFIRNNFPAYED